MKVTAFWISGFCFMGGLCLRYYGMHGGGRLILLGLLILLVTLRQVQVERDKNRL